MQQKVHTNEQLEKHYAGQVNMSNTTKEVRVQELRLQMMDSPPHHNIIKEIQINLQMEI